MSRFRFSLVSLGIIVVAITTIGATAGHVAPLPRPTARPLLLAAHPHAAQPSPADSEWALAAHVAW